MIRRFILLMTAQSTLHLVQVRRAPEIIGFRDDLAGYWDECKANYCWMSAALVGRAGGWIFLRHLRL